MCLNLSHLEGVWPKVELSCLSYGCCWGSSWTLSEISPLFPSLSRTMRKISFPSHRSSPAKGLSSWCFVVWGYIFTEGEIVLSYSSDGNSTLGNVVFSLVRKLKIWRRNTKHFLMCCFGLCSCLKSALMQVDWAFPRSVEMAWKMSQRFEGCKASY